MYIAVGGATTAPRSVVTANPPDADALASTLASTSVGPASDFGTARHGPVGMGHAGLSAQVVFIRYVTIAIYSSYYWCGEC